MEEGNESGNRKPMRGVIPGDSVSGCSGVSRTSQVHRKSWREEDGVELPTPPLPPFLLSLVEPPGDMNAELVQALRTPPVPRRMLGRSHKPRKITEKGRDFQGLENNSFFQF